MTSCSDTKTADRKHKLSVTT